jgi:hypothetical protein
MTTEMTAFGEGVESVSTVCLWGAVLLRSPSAVRSPRQRGLWLAVATAAVAMTLSLPSVNRLIAGWGGPSHAVALTKNLFGVVSAGAVLYFVAVTTGSRYLRFWSHWGVAATLAGLLLLDAAGEAPMYLSTSDSSLPSLVYWLLLIAAHLLANTACVYVCWRYGGMDAPLLLRSSLRLFGTGSALAGLYWIGHLVSLFTTVDWITSNQPVVMGAHALFRAAAILAPTVDAVRRTAADIRTTWSLRPLWRDLTDAVPHVALTRSRPRTLEIVWPLVPWKLLAYRKVIETRDAILVLQNYVDPTVLDLARDFVATLGIPEARRDAAVLACVLREARQAKLAGGPSYEAGTSPAGLLGLGSGDLADEKTFLLYVTKAYESSALEGFSARVCKETLRAPSTDGP